MLVDEAANILGISYRSIYRMIHDGTLPVSVKSRDRPVIIKTEVYDVADTLVQDIKARIAGKATPAVIKRILQQLKGGK